MQIFDTTLRDGEQSPGASMTAEQKVIIARQLEKLGVDVIEAGFAASSEGDFDSVRQSLRGSDPAASGESGARPGERYRARFESGREARESRYSHVHRDFGHSSQAQIAHDSRASGGGRGQGGKSRKQFTDYIEFSAEDASRSDPEFLIQVFREVIRAGAKVINVPDTTGYAIPSEFGALMANLIERTAGGDRVIWSAHCHNDLGLAVANSLARCITARVKSSARSTASANAPATLLSKKWSWRCARAKIISISTPTSSASSSIQVRDLVSQVTGIPIPINKPIVGDNAFAHEAGIHQDGVLKHKQTYEIMTPESIGIPGNRLVMGKHSGRHAFDERLKHLGFNLSKEDMNRAFLRFKELADKKKNVYDEDIEAIVAEEILRVPGRPDKFELLYMNVQFEL